MKDALLRIYARFETIVVGTLLFLMMLVVLIMLLVMFIMYANLVNSLRKALRQQA